MEQAIWDNEKALRQLANALLAVSLLLLLAGVLHYAVHLPEFPLRTVQLTAPPQHVDAAQLGEIVHNELHGNFFTVDLDGVRKAFEKLPWVRKVSVRRRFPWQLEVDLEEQVALANWNGTELVNTHGEVFAGDPQAALPKFFGEPDTAAEVMQMYKAFSDQLAPLGRHVAQISLSPRRAWQLRLDNGMVIELGREQAQQRLARFVEVYPYSLAPTQRPAGYVDLRYRNGFAAYLPGGMKTVKGGL